MADTTPRHHRYIDLPPDERAKYERLFGGRMPVDAEVGPIGEPHGYTMLSMSLKSPRATDEDLLIATSEQ